MAFSANTLKYLNSADFYVALPFPGLRLSALHVFISFLIFTNIFPPTHTHTYTTREATCQVLLHFMSAFAHFLFVFL